MPTYEYRCTSCSDQFEIVQSFKDASLTVCNTCQGLLRKVYGNVGISFKGTGFYKNDSKSSTGAGNGAASPASETSTTKTDTATSTGSTESSSPAQASTGSSHGAAPASTPAAT